MCWSGLDYRFCVSFFPKRNFSAIFINVDRLILVMKVNVNTHNKMPQLLNGWVLYVRRAGVFNHVRFICYATRV